MSYVELFCSCKQIQNLDGQGQIVSSVQTILTCSKLIQPQAMIQIIKYIYGEEIDYKFCNIGDLKQVTLRKYITLLNINIIG